MTATRLTRAAGLAAAALVSFVGSSLATDDTLPEVLSWQADPGWQAHALLTVGGEEITLEIYRDGRRERQETTLDGILQVVIVRPELGRAFIIVPERDDVLAIAIEDAGLLPFSVGFGDAETELIGEETLGGETTLHYRVTGPDALGQYFDGDVWVTPDGIPLRMAGELDAGGDVVDFSVQLSLVSRGKQPDYLFAPPVETPSPLSEDG
jgi:hypothetical protein